MTGSPKNCYDCAFRRLFDEGSSNRFRDKLYKEGICYFQGDNKRYIDYADINIQPPFWCPYPSFLDDSDPQDDWISVKDRLPENEQYVFIYAGNYNQSMKYDVACFIKGLTAEEAEKRGRYTGADVFGNNLVPYTWSTFGPMEYFGQDVTHWMPLPNPPKKTKYTCRTCGQNLP